MLRRFIASLALVVALTGSAPANDNIVTLWEQLPDPAALAFVDQRFSDFQDFSTFLVNDVVFNTNVTLDQITVYFTNLNNTWPGAATATLNIFANDGTLDTEDPLAGATVNITLNDTADGFAIVTDSLNMALSAGSYWIGLTPNLDFGAFNQEFHQQSAGVVGSETWARNPGGGFGLGGNWQTGGTLFGQPPFDSAFKVTGKESVIPEPTAIGLLAFGFVGLLSRRRR
jgi:hypothetical protein